MEYFHVFPTSYLRRRKGPAAPERDLQKMDRVKLALPTPKDAWDQIFRTFSSGKTETRLREHSG